MKTFSNKFLNGLLLIIYCSKWYYFDTDFKFENFSEQKNLLNAKMHGKILWNLKAMMQKSGNQLGLHHF
jgi:hypothetical protein